MGRTAVAIISQFEQIGELIVADFNEKEQSRRITEFGEL